MIILLPLSLLQQRLEKRWRVTPMSSRRPAPCCSTCPGRGRGGATGSTASSPSCVVGLALWWLIKRLADTGQFNAAKWDVFTYEQVRSDLFAGLKNTLKAFALGSVLALAFGTVFAAGRLSDHAWLRWPAHGRGRSCSGRSRWSS